MKEKPVKLWYASYGSNMLEERFMCYIGGGRPEGAKRTYEGCSNKSKPERTRPVTIPAELYFARNSKTWHGGGICFLNPDPDAGQKTLGRMYLITSDQFEELVKQESRYQGELSIDFEKASREGYLILKIKSWYGRLLFLGYEDGYPVFTFTNENYLNEEFNPPHESYLNMIRRGIKETYGMSDEEIEDYLKNKKGYPEKLKNDGDPLKP